MIASRMASILIISITQMPFQLVCQWNRFTTSNDIESILMSHVRGPMYSCLSLILPCLPGTVTYTSFYNRRSWYVVIHCAHQKIASATILLTWTSVRPCCILQNDEGYILPVLIRFDGQPEVDEEVTSNCVFVKHFKIFTLHWFQFNYLVMYQKYDKSCIYVHKVVCCFKFFR